MTAPLLRPAPERVRQALVLGLLYRDAATGAPLSAPLSAIIETAGTRIARLAMMQKPDGAALRFDPRNGRLLAGPANGITQITLLIAPSGGLGRAMPPDRSVIPRRIRLPLALDGDGLPRANGAAPEGKWIFPVNMHCGPTFPLAAGTTAIRGRIAWQSAGDAEGKPLRWGHLVAKLPNGDVVATARTDDRGEYVLKIRRIPNQLPNILKPISVTLTIHALAAALSPATPFADVPTEILSLPDTTADAPPPGSRTLAGPMATVQPGQILTLKTHFIPP